MTVLPSLSAKPNSSALRALNEFSASGDFVFHGSGRRGIYEFNPKTPNGIVFGPFGCIAKPNPLVYACPSFEAAAIVALSRDGGSPGFAWATVELMSKRIATTFALPTPELAGQVTSAIHKATTEGPSTSTVYVFRRSDFQAEHPIVSEYIAASAVKPVDEIPLKKEDVHWLIENLIPLDSLFLATDNLIMLGGSVVWEQGGHIQHSLDGRLLHRSVPSPNDLIEAVERNVRRHLEYSEGHDWGRIIWPEAARKLLQRALR